MLGAAASRLRGAGSACGKGLGGALEKGLWAYNTAQRVAGIQKKLQSGAIVGGGAGHGGSGGGCAAGPRSRPPADWRSLLREFLSANARNDYSWVRPNRRLLQQGLYLPGLHLEELGDVVVAVDTFGSVGERELAVFAREVQGVLDAFDCTVTVLYHDTSVCGKQRCRSTDGPLVLEPVGGGGTSHEYVFEWLARSDVLPSCLVCLTDLETRFPTQVPDLPVLWAVVRDAGRRPPFGQLVPIGT